MRAIVIPALKKSKIKKNKPIKSIKYRLPLEKEFDILLGNSILFWLKTYLILVERKDNIFDLLKGGS